MIKNTKTSFENVKVTRVSFYTQIKVVEFLHSGQPSGQPQLYGKGSLQYTVCGWVTVKLMVFTHHKFPRKKWMVVLIKKGKTTGI